MARSSARTGRAASNVVPVAAFVAALLLALVLLPSTLRPPPDPASTAAEFSPDAPPDENQDSIVAALGRASSGTAGGGQGVGVGNIQEQAPVAAPAPTASRFCPYGFGNPPRQTFSLYSGACAPAFVGDNGGSTWRGVSGDQIVVAVAPNGGPRPSKTGWIPTEPTLGETGADRTWRVFQTYFNQRFQLYGRQLRLYGIRTEPTSAERVAAAAEADEVDAFAVVGRGPEFFHEAVRRGMIAWGANGMDARYFTDQAPYMWSWAVDGNTVLEMTADLWCKQLHGRPAEWSRDSVVGGSPRKMGFITYESAVHRDFASILRDELRERCDASITTTITYNLGDNASGLAGAITRMRSDGVTTVVCACDEITPAALTNEAANQGYFPEWLVTGVSMIDLNSNARLYNPSQWSQAFGLSTLEMDRPEAERDGWMAYHDVDPEADPHAETVEQYFHQLQQLVVGLQSAGPDLTPDTYMKGLQRSIRRAADPPWAVAGGYAPGDFTYADWAALVWWDPTAAGSDGRPGAYRHLDGGRRYRVGEIPSGRHPFFEEGISQPG